jgi:hypothetical protein
MGVPDMRSPAPRGDADRAGNCRSLTGLDNPQNTPNAIDLQARRATWLRSHYGLSEVMAAAVADLAFETWRRG